MKVVRLLLSLLVGFILLSILAVVLVWPFLRVDERLRQVMTKQIGRSLSGNADIQNVHLGWGRLDFLGLEASDTQDRWSVKIQNASIQFNPLNLFTHGFNPLGILSTVTAADLSRPEVFLRLSRTDSLPKPDDTSRFNGWTILDNLPKELVIGKIQFGDGIFHLADADGEPLITVSGLNLELYSPNPGTWQGRLTSSKLGARSLNSKLDLALDRRARTLEASLYADLEQLRLGAEIGLPDSLSLSLDSLGVNLHLWALDNKTGLNGEVAFKRLSLDGDLQELATTEPARLIIGDWNLYVPEIKVHGLSSDWRISGNIPDLRAPTLDMSITAHSDDCADLAFLLPEKSGIEPHGMLDLAAAVKGPIASPQITANVDLGRLTTPQKNFERLHFSGSYENKLIAINEFKAHTEEGVLSLEGQAQVDGRQSAGEAEFSWAGSIPGLPNSRQGVLRGSIVGERGEFQVNAGWETDGGSSLHLTGYYSHGADSLKININLADSARVSLITTHLTNHPNFVLQLDEPQKIARQIISWDHWNQLDSLRFTGDFSGPLDQLSCRIQAHQIQAASNISLRGVFGIKSSSWADFTGNISMQRGAGAPLDGRIAVVWKDGILTLHSLELDNAIVAYGSFNTVTGEISSAELQVTGWPLSRGMAIFFPQIAAQWGAVLDIRAEVYGSLDHPEGSFNLYVSQGFFAEHTDFWAMTSADLQKDTLRVSAFNIGRGVLSLVKADGLADLVHSDLKFHMFTNLADIANVLELFGGNPAKITGPLKVDANLVGNFSKPELKLQAGMTYGSVYHIPFDSLSASLRFDLLTDQALVLSDFRLMQKPDLTLEVQGILPFNQHPLDLQMQLKGNILKILHQIEPDILVSRGDGELMLEVAQVNDKLSLMGASLDLRDGYLKLPAVVNEIRAINARMAFKGNQLHIENVSGEVEEQKFRLSNTFDDPTYSHLDPLYFSGPNIDLGVMIMETFGRGLHAHIPELMINGTKGYITLSGKNGQPRFTASGPIEQPLFYGTCNVAGAVVTFPFPPGDGKPPSRFVRGVLRVLKSARWDVLVIPERDNRYVYEVKPVEGKNFLGGVSELIASVNIDLNLDASDSRLNVIGSLDQNDFRPIGNLISTRGTVEYLDLNFRVERFEAEFTKSDTLPLVDGRASTVYSDSMGFSHTIYLKLYVIDPTTGERQERGRWGDFVYILEDDIGSSQEQILAALGYSPGTVTAKVTSLGGTILTGVVLRSFIRPVERQLENVLQLDVIRLQPTIAQHLFESQILGTDPGPGGGPQSQIVWGAYFLRQSQLTVGKYLSDDVFMSYNGTWKTAISAANERHFGFLHRFNLDYRIRPVSGNLVLTMGYEWDSLELLQDRKVSLRYSFAFR